MYHSAKVHSFVKKKIISHQFERYLARFINPFFPAKMEQTLYYIIRSVKSPFQIVNYNLLLSLAENTKQSNRLLCKTRLPKEYIDAVLSSVAVSVVFLSFSFLKKVPCKWIKNDPVRLWFTHGYENWSGDLYWNPLEQHSGKA